MMDIPFTTVSIDTRKMSIEVDMEKEETGDIFRAFCEEGFCYIYKKEDVYEAELRDDEYGNEYIWEKFETTYIPYRFYKGNGSFVFLETIIKYGGFINIDYRIKVKD